MPGQIQLPNEVLESIRKHVDTAVNHAEKGYSSAMEEEDTITGELGGALRTDTERIVKVSNWQPPGNWRWSITYSKFRSKAKGAPESVVGADGILEIRVGSIERDQRKSALFQAKNTNKFDPNLIEQCTKMSVWREASFVISYAATGYEAYSLDAVFLARGSLSVAKNGRPLAPWIIESFIGCQVGHPDLYYKKEERRLHWLREPAFEGEYESTRWVWMDFRPKHLIHIDVTPPDWREEHAVQIEATKVSFNRLAFTPDDLFGMKGPFTLRQLKKRRDELLSAYHSDHNHHLGYELRANLDRRVIEIYETYSKLLPDVISEKKVPKPRMSKKTKSSAALQTGKMAVDDFFATAKKRKRVKVRRTK